MTCEEFENHLQQVEDFQNASPPMEAHRQTCTGCAELVEDLNHLVRQAREMLPLEQPSERVWLEIRRELERSGLVQDPVRRRFRWAAPATGWFPRLPMGLAYASVFLVALGVVYLHSILYSVPPSPPLASPPVVARIPELSSGPDQPIRQLVEKAPPEKRAIYVSNLEQVNATIDELSSFLASHPEDLFAREQLLTAVEQKERLWETLSRWEEF